MAKKLESIVIEVTRKKDSAIDPSERDPCPGCSSYLAEPFIRCAECSSKNYLLCLQCFAKGFESGKHNSSHKYEIITNNFPILDYNWSAAEEMRLLDALADCGSGNWTAVASQVKTKTKHECETHYMKCYVLHARYPLPEMPRRPGIKPSPPIPFKACEDPCRPLPESHRAQDMAGYLAARGDFSEEYDNNAEWHVKDIYFGPDDWPVLKSLKLAIVKIYQSRLKERGRRKEIMRKHGLININNHTLRYLRKLPREQRELLNMMKPFQHLQHPIAHDKMLAGFALEDSLKKRVSKLRDYRKAGISSHRVCRIYEKLKQLRSEQEPQTSFLTEVLSLKHDMNALMQWIQRQASINNGSFQNSSAGPIIPIRKSTPLLDISDLPGVEKLNSEEKEFCAQARLVPEAYLHYKSLLIAECMKTGHLKLAQARNLVKIDVNKTRKLYDFVVKQGYVTGDANGKADDI